MELPAHRRERQDLSAFFLFQCNWSIKSFLEVVVFQVYRSPYSVYADFKVISSSKIMLQEDFSWLFTVNDNLSYLFPLGYLLYPMLLVFSQWVEVEDFLAYQLHDILFILPLTGFHYGYKVFRLVD